MEADKDADKLKRVMQRKLSRMIAEVDNRIPGSQFEDQLALSGEGSGYHRVLAELESGKLLYDSQPAMVKKEA